MNVSKNKFVVVTIGIMMIFLNYYILAVDIVQLSPGWEYRAGITTVILIVYSLISWRILGLKYASPTFFVLFSLYMFHLSSITVIGFDTSTEYDYMQMLYRYGDEWGFQGTLYSELFIEVYLLGVLMFSKSNTELADYDETKGTDGNSLEICRSIGLCMLAISILPQLYHDVIQIGAKIAGGYQAMFESDTTFYGIPLGWFTKLFLPAILLVLSSYRNNKRRFTIVMGITAAYFLIFMFFTGRKGNTIQTLSLIHIYHMDNVTFIPYQDKADLIYSLNAGDVHWCVNAKGIKGVSCPSKAYGIMAASKPILGVLEAGSEVRCLIEDTHGGLCCEPGEYDKVEENIRWFIENAGNSELKAMGARGRDNLEKNLTRNVSVRKYAEEILKL